MTENEPCVPSRAVRDFIPSDEVRSFLEAREHTFTLPEAALIIRRSRRQMPEINTQWRSWSDWKRRKKNDRSNYRRYCRFPV